jgi:hypothetical protein
MAFPAQHSGTCQRCKGTITPGERINIRNRPFTGARFHETCPGQHPETETIPETETAASTPEETAASTPETEGDSIDSMIERRIRAAFQKYKPTATVTEEMVRRLIAEGGSQRIEIAVQHKDGTETKIENAHFLMDRTLRLIRAGISLYFWGPAGSGKTTMALDAAKALSLMAELDTLDPSTPKSGILGYRTPTGEPVWTATLRRYAEGGIIIWDEMDNAPGHVQNVGNSMLANGHAPAAWGMVPRHETFGFIGTGNTPGRPTPRFPDRKNMSAAFADRLYFIHVPLDPNIERRATGRSPAKVPARLGTVREITPAAWGRWVEEIRAWSEKNAPTLQVTPRATITGLRALAAGETPEEVAHGLVFRGADDSLVSKALEACPLPGAV